MKGGQIWTIKHLPVSMPTKTLGQMTCPTGCSNGAIARRQEKAQGWLSKAKESTILARGLLWHK